MEKPPYSGHCGELKCGLSHGPLLHEQNSPVTAKAPKPGWQRPGLALGGLPARRAAPFHSPKARRHRGA